MFPSCCINGVSPQGIMLVYDVTMEKSFDNIRNWIRNIEEVGILINAHGLLLISILIYHYHIV